MADGPLLSEADKREIRDSIKLVTDQFFVTPVDYYRYLDSTDRFNEDRADRFSNVYQLNALVEYPSGGSDWAKELQQGSIDSAHVKVTLNYEDLLALNLLPALGTDFDVDYDSTQVIDTLINDVEKIHKMIAGSDKFYTQGQWYKVVYAGYDGPLDRQNVLIIVYGETRKTENAPIVPRHG